MRSMRRAFFHTRAVATTVSCRTSFKFTDGDPGAQVHPRLATRSILSAVIAQGALRFAAYEGRFTAYRLHRLLQAAAFRQPRPGLPRRRRPPHAPRQRSRRFVASTTDQLQIVPAGLLAPPQPRRTGGVGKNVKADRIG